MVEGATGRRKGCGIAEVFILASSRLFLGSAAPPDQPRSISRIQSGLTPHFQRWHSTGFSERPYSVQ